jgi:hypothetical protein
LNFLTTELFNIHSITLAPYVETKAFSFSHQFLVTENLEIKQNSPEIRKIKLKIYFKKEKENPKFLNFFVEKVIKIDPKNTLV